MNIWVAGQDDTKTLRDDINRRANAMHNADYEAMLDGESGICDLRDATNGETYLTRLLGLLQRRFDVNPALYTQPRTPGLKGRLSYALRLFLWRLLRYQHFWHTFHQNGINAAQTEALVFENEERKQRIAELEARITELERVVKIRQTETS